MMGGHHAVCGAAAWIAVSTSFTVPLGLLADRYPQVPESLVLGLGLVDSSPMGAIAGALVCAGAALLPDADHRHATIAQSLPPVSNAVCAGIGTVSGGHRNGTHSLLGMAVFAAIAWVAGLWTIETERFGTVFPGAGLMAVLLVSFAAKALRFVPDSMRRFPWLLAVPAGLFVMLSAPQEPYWLVLAVALGTAVHILGDMLTTGGCNLLWPVRIRSPRLVRRLPVLRHIWRPSGRLAVPVLGNAGSVREWILCIAISGYAAVGLLAAGLAAGRNGAVALAAFLGR